MAADIVNYFTPASGFYGGTLIIAPKAYSIGIGTSAGGTFTAGKTVAQAGETVTLTVAPATGYELAGISATGVTLNDSGNTRTFTMPAADVTVQATFQKTVAQLAWENVIPLIEDTIFTLKQEEASDASAACYPLAAQINALIVGTGFIVSPYDIVIYFFQPAVAISSATATDVPATYTGSASTAGRFEFRVSPPNVAPSAYNSGAISPADHTGNATTGEHAGSPLRAYVNNFLGKPEKLNMIYSASIMNRLMLFLH